MLGRRQSARDSDLRPALGVGEPTPFAERAHVGATSNVESLRCDAAMLRAQHQVIGQPIFASDAFLIDSQPANRRRLIASRFKNRSQDAYAARESTIAVRDGSNVVPWRNHPSAREHERQKFAC
jgi:hypothetical protein